MYTLIYNKLFFYTTGLVKVNKISLRPLFVAGKNKSGNTRIIENFDNKVTSHAPKKHYSQKYIYLLQLNSLLFLAIALLSLSGCKPDKPDKPEPIPGRKVWILNEGNYDWGNGSVTVYQPDSQRVETEDGFLAANNRIIGNVLQSGIQIDDRTIGLVVNNSQKIEWVDSKTLVSQKTTEGMLAPRFGLQTGPEELWVSDLYADRIHRINLTTRVVSGHLPRAGWNEEMVWTGNKVWVTNRRTDFDTRPQGYGLFAFNPQTGVWTDSLVIGFQAQRLALAPDGKLWTAASPKPVPELNFDLIHIEPKTNTILNRYALPEPVRKIVYDKTRNRLLVLAGSVYSLGIGGQTAPIMLIPAAGRLLYGMGVDPKTGDIYLTDALDYVQRSEVYRYNSAGVQTDRFRAGVIASEFLFVD
jgi:hypothetical protein